MTQHDMACPPFPQSWLRDAWALLPGGRGGSSASIFTDAREQLCAVHRWLGMVAATAAEEGHGLSWLSMMWFAASCPNNRLFGMVAAAAAEEDHDPSRLSALMSQVACWFVASCQSCRFFGMVAAAAAEEGHDLSCLSQCCGVRLHVNLAGCLAWWLQQLPRKAMTLVGFRL